MKGGGLYFGGAAEVLGTDDLLRPLMEAVPATIVCAKPTGELLFINRTERAPETVAGRSVWDFTDPRFHETIRACFAEVVRTRRNGRFETVGEGPREGTVACYDTQVAPVERDGEVVALMLIATDITDIKLAARALHESDEKLRLAVAAAGVGLWSWDPIRDEVTWDERLLEIFGRTREQAPRTIAEYNALVHPDDRAVVQNREGRARDDGTITNSECRVVRPDGEVRWIQVRGQAVRDSDGRVIKLVGGTLDVTERRAVDARLRQSQKLEAVGQLTAGIAHNFNNLLMAILPNLELAGRLPAEEASPLIADARRAAERAQQLVRQLLVFAGHKPPAEHSVQHVAPIVAQTVSICRGTFDRRLTIEAASANDVPPVAVDAGQIEQALLNVCINARDAMRDRTNRRLGIGVDVLPVDHAEIAAHPAAVARPHVRIRIEDTGHGMDEATRRRIFEPFFTTKAVGQGTGLGLATAYAILKAHEGWISVDSTPGEGSTFSLVLPAAEGAPGEVSRGVSAPRGGNERLLIVDDEPLVRQVVRRVLEEAGYGVVCAETATEATARHQAEPDGFAVVLLDISLPDGSGRDVCRDMKARRPQQRVILFSGLATDDPEGADGVVLKPVGIDVLLGEVRRVLDR